ncbi:MAG: DNA translocase FtsK 4TM domain-containing protein [Bacteroidales bacterium]|nr:DNA translocase FtsK 4TM domain-containing protein [Bacteroidales bacterium]
MGKFFKKPDFKSLIPEISEERKEKIVFACGLVLVAFTVFTLVSVVSYFFSWKTDQSLLGDPEMMSQTLKAGNSGGKLGVRWGNFLVGKGFGLAALGLVALLVFWCVKMLSRKSSIPVLKPLVIALSGTFLASLVLAFLSPLVGAANAFGSGLGGRFGSTVVLWSANLVGPILTALAILVLICLFLMLLSRRFYLMITMQKDPSYGQEIDMDGVEEVAQTVDEENDPEPAWQDYAIPSYPDPEPEPEPDIVVSSREDETPSNPEQSENEGLEVITDDTLSAEVKKDLPRIDNRDELPQYRFPSLDILGDYESSRREVSQEELVRNNNKIRATLANYKIQVVDVKAIVGPTVTLYKVYPAPGVKISAIKNLQDDIAMSLNARGVRVVTLSDSVGIEVANDSPSIVPLKALLNDPAFRESKAELPVAIGYTITQKVKVFDLADAPHLLVAGATKQGKSVGLNVIVASLLYSKHPSELKFVFIDPKMVEFSAYGKLLNHYLAVLPSAASEQDEKDSAIVKNAKAAAEVLKSLCLEMDQRYELLSRATVNNIKLYNEKYKDRHLLPSEGHRFLPYIVVVVDEYADLTMSVGAGPESKALARSITTSVIRLAQKGRAAGLHVILATQRPTVDVVTGLIKTNFPMRIAFRVTSRVDSATILDAPGADKLIGKGDMLLYSGIEMERVQCGFISNDEIIELTESVGCQKGYKRSYNTPYYLPEPEPDAGDEGGGGMIDMKQLDERFEEAARLIVSTQRGSTSDLQRRLGMGYAKAGRVMDQLEAAGIVGPQAGSKPREVLVRDFAELDGILKAFLGK